MHDESADNASRTPGSAPKRQVQQHRRVGVVNATEHGGFILLPGFTDTTTRAASRRGVPRLDQDLEMSDKLSETWQAGQHDRVLDVARRLAAEAREATDPDNPTFPFETADVLLGGRVPCPLPQPDQTEQRTGSPFHSEERLSDFTVEHSRASFRTIYMHCA